ncbi:DNA-binding transcriptional regulator, MocR family, contains an aminotransferase domain [Nakamurella panacisegetis]|uniref:DNA-binding transcriptional regulator, MocR family, contains an aminotransferase domain n=1 Tax=Nakamurella panacisegetis TaxID=1090615 RepID=A0A1H0QUU2_9ACTN|nr:PLP-dependent aminotransferase family protein [Nakamurella panacisegetis]SDP21054.1 DNA-binding transcriptional regulator, MocR family, contains an aminotransferase domain [Nakamurella panacisegetis]
MNESTARISAATLVRRLGPLPAGGSGPAYRNLAERIRNAVLDGRLAVSAGLPSERELAAGLTLSRTTVAAAYTLLRQQGWLDSRRGSGSRLRLPGTDSGAVADPARSVGPAGWFGVPEPSGPDVIDLATASLPAPAEAITAAAAKAVADLPAHLGGDGYSPYGLLGLREAIADRYTLDGVPTTADQILVTNGAQHAFTLTLQELTAPGDRVLIECPTYPLALDAIRAARRIPGPVGLPGPDQEQCGGPWDPDLIAATLRQTAPRLAYLIPDFQNPTGAVMDAETRAAVARAARASNTPLLIDESFRDMSFPGREALPPRMASFDSGLRMVSLGSLSKSFWGGLRIGWIRAAPTLINRLATGRALGDMSGPVLDQLLAIHLLRDPQDALDLQRGRLASGAATLTGALTRLLPRWQASRPTGGAFLWVALPGPFASELARLAPSVGLRIAPGPRFGPDGTMESYLRLPFSQPPEKLTTAVHRLAAIADRAAERRPTDVSGWLA